MLHQYQNGGLVQFSNAVFQLQIYLTTLNLNLLRQQHGGVGDAGPLDLLVHLVPEHLHRTANSKVYRKDYLCRNRIMLLAGVGWR